MTHEQFHDTLVALEPHMIRLDSTLWIGFKTNHTVVANYRKPSTRVYVLDDTTGEVIHVTSFDGPPRELDGFVRQFFGLDPRPLAADELAEVVKTLPPEELDRVRALLRETKR